MVLDGGEDRDPQELVGGQQRPDLLLQAGRVSVIDLSDTDSPQVNNLVIASILRGVQVQQESAFAEAQAVVCLWRPLPISRPHVWLVAGFYHGVC